MAFQSVPQCAEAVIKGGIGSRTIVNVLNFSFGATYSAANIAQLAAALDTEFNSSYPPLSNGNVVYQGVQVTGLANVNDFTAGSFSGPTAGSSGTIPLPSNTSLVVTLRTALTGRSARGRFYAWPTGSSNMDTPPDTAKTTYAAALEAMLTDAQLAAAAAGWALVIVSRHTAKTLRPVGVAFPVTAIAVRNLSMDSQRGRLAKGH